MTSQALEKSRKQMGQYYGSAYLEPGPVEIKKGVNDTIGIQINNNLRIDFSLLNEGEETVQLTGNEIINKSIGASGQAPEKWT